MALFVKIRACDCAPVNNSGRRLYRTPYWCNLDWPLDSFLRLVLVSSTTISVIDPRVYVHPTIFLQFITLSTLRFSFPFTSPIPLYWIYYISHNLFARNIEKKKERIIQMKVTSLSLSFSLLNKTRIKWKWKSMIWRRRKNKKRQKGEQWRERDELSSQLNSTQRSLPPRWSHPSSYNLIGMRMPLLGGITPLSALESLLKTQ